MRVYSIFLMVALWCLLLDVRLVSSVETDSVSSSSEQQSSAAKASNTRGRRRVQNEDEVEVEVAPSWFGGLANNFRTFLNNVRAGCDDDALPDDSGNSNVPTEAPALAPTKCDNDDLPDDSANPDVPTEPPAPAPTNPVPAPTEPVPAPTEPVPEPAPVPPPTPGPTVFVPQYLGCWRDANDRAMELSVGNGYGIYSCVGHCRGKGYAYAGVQWHDQCQCGNSYNKHGQTGESECNTACIVGSGMCGGSWRISVYTTGIPAGPVPAPTLPPTRPPTAPPPTRAPTPAPVSQFGITLGLSGVPAQYDYFSNAVAKWSTVIVGDLPDVNGYLGGTSTCGAWPEAIDDVFICGKYKDIDGAGGVLGFAGPRHFRDNQVKKLPLTGEMVFDMADVVRPSVNLLAVIVSTTVYRTTEAVGMICDGSSC